MKGLLRDVMGTKGGSKLGDDRSGWNVTFIDVEHHVEGNDTDLVGKDGALVVEEDVRHDLHVRRAASRPTHTPTPPPRHPTAARHLINPTHLHAHDATGDGARRGQLLRHRRGAPPVRLHGLALGQEQREQEGAERHARRRRGLLGRDVAVRQQRRCARRTCLPLPPIERRRSMRPQQLAAAQSSLDSCDPRPISRRRAPPPFAPTDQRRFRSWFDAAVAGRDAGRGFYDGNGLPFMSAALRERIPDEGLVHCWVRTHAMVRRPACFLWTPQTNPRDYYPLSLLRAARCLSFGLITSPADSHVCRAHAALPHPFRDRSTTT